LITAEISEAPDVKIDTPPASIGGIILPS